MIPENINQGEHELTNMIERAREGIVNTANLNPDDFLRAKYEHMMKRFGLINFLRFLRGWKRKATRTTGAVLGACRPPPVRTCQDIAADGRWPRPAQ